MGSSPSPTPGFQSTKHDRKKKPEMIVDSDSNSSESDSGSENGNGVVNSTAQDVDEVVLSHAARRKQMKEAKRKQREEENNDVDSAGPKKRRKLNGGRGTDAVDRDVKRKNSVWVGNMTFKTTEEELKTFFKDRGLGEVIRIHMPSKAGGKPGFKSENRGFAYVDFDSTEDKQAAIALSEQPLLGRKLLIKDGDDFTGRPNQSTENAAITINGVKKSLSKTSQKILKNQKQPPAPTLFFGNLGFDTIEDSIRVLLEAHREKDKRKEQGESTEEKEEKEEKSWIRKVRLGTFEDSGKCKGFAFVDFLNTEHATSALVNPKNHHLNGRDLVVEYASAEAVRRGAPKTPKIKSPVERTLEAGQFERKPRITKPPLNKAKFSDAEAVDTKQADHPIGLDMPEKSRSWNRGNRDQHRPLRGRPKPGAALAQAKRESAAIVPSQGQKITF
ncbi:hypothetical protein AGABI1DRAFT_72681 [Agaricus bisporus var. burnettii JB137-S8]|uniref:RRM domain-containing protein n=1 Tax=Agaricus bisporus var. burnettii (strain JB137-S8 / ATCC MYA-4627 / FGSC 10392) TaxID=597362 RepID=K5VZK7_AGABU|nr:uncharacterized protein AGABI1DRAFT_72681 [Agaricus bisporus var. burnettii JB137-S8]EKM79954.1 hypothetical protein AGABI1DRAFT_72681 [Agaricus bisporus var. burnettii JB137-S8]